MRCQATFRARHGSDQSRSALKSRRYLWASHKRVGFTGSFAYLFGFFTWNRFLVATLNSEFPK